MNLLNRLFGESSEFNVEGIALGKLDENRLLLARSHIDGLIKQEYQKKINDLTVNVGSKKGGCTIHVKTKKGVDTDSIQEMKEYMKGVLRTEASCQRLLTELLQVIDSDGEAGYDGLIQYGGHEIKEIGRKIHDQLGIGGMKYIAHSVGTLRPTPGLVRLIDSLWSRIGEWLG